MKHENSEKITDPPADLSETSKALWRDVVGNRVNSKERMALLHQSLLALDRAEEAAEIVKKQGMVIVTETSGAYHLHPCLKVECENRALFARI